MKTANRTGSIMIQGTSSGVGKSVITAGICRILRRKGLRVSPFKAQNMALNSHVTPDGCEIGKAQAVQAEASGVSPRHEMNPILLKPQSGGRSQVIISGKVHGTLDHMEYRDMKPYLKEVIRKSYAALEKDSDVIVIEGAGSPVELNLLHDDIANMGIADLVDAPVILVADIDRGGAFASIAGTLALMEPQHRNRVKGIIINKFRGSASLFKDGTDIIERLTGIPVLGVVPHMDVDIEDEDTISESLRSPSNDVHNPDVAVKASVVRLPHISNFTDFKPLECDPRVSLSYADSAEALGSPDIVIIPGTKDTLFDLGWMRDNGIDRRILELGRSGSVIIGICGGLQMMGSSIIDDEGVESSSVGADGMGLIDALTRFHGSKVTRWRSCVMACGPFLEDMADSPLVVGYEIHMGRTEFGPGSLPFIVSGESDECPGEILGVISSDGMAIATYLHGLFDNNSLTQSLISSVMSRRGAGGEDVTSFDYASAKEASFERLADELEGCLDIEETLRIAGV